MIGKVSDIKRLTLQLSKSGNKFLHVACHLKIRANVGFVWVFTLNLLHFRKVGKGGRTKGGTIGVISKSARGKFQNSQAQ